MTAAPPVLLVGHDASRTGAPKVAADLVGAMVASGAAEVRVALLAGGPLTARLRALAPTSVPSAPEVLASKALGPAAHGARLRLAARAFARPPIVVANTVASWSAAAAIERRRALVCWVHELDHVADALVHPAMRAELISATDRFLAVSPAVATMLTDRWGVDAARVRVAAPFADPPAAGSGPGPESLRVLGAGSLVPRKGPDLFVAVLAELSARRPLGAGSAAWVGGDLAAPTAALVRADRRAAGLEEALVLAGTVPTLDPWWPADGLLLHVAREDPAPLVVLEAALRGVPVATWATGGAADLLRAAGCEHLVAPAGDLLAVASCVEHLLHDRDARVAAGRALRQAAARRTTEHGAPAAIDAILGAP